MKRRKVTTVAENTPAASLDAMLRDEEEDDDDDDDDDDNAPGGGNVNVSGSGVGSVSGVDEDILEQALAGAAAMTAASALAASPAALAPIRGQTAAAHYSSGSHGVPHSASLPSAPSSVAPGLNGSGGGTVNTVRGPDPVTTTITTAPTAGTTSHTASHLDALPHDDSSDPHGVRHSTRVRKPAGGTPTTGPTIATVPVPPQPLFTGHAPFSTLSYSIQPSQPNHPLLPPPPTVQNAQQSQAAAAAAAAAAAEVQNRRRNAATNVEPGHDLTALQGPVGPAPAQALSATVSMSVPYLVHSAPVPAASIAAISNVMSVDGSPLDVVRASNKRNKVISIAPAADGASSDAGLIGANAGAGGAASSRARLSGYNLVPTRAYPCLEPNCTYSSSVKHLFRTHQRMHIETTEGLRPQRCLLMNPWTDPVTGQVKQVQCTYAGRDKLALSLHTVEHSVGQSHRRKKHRGEDGPSSSSSAKSTSSPHAGAMPGTGHTYCGYNLIPARRHRCVEQNCTYSSALRAPLIEHQQMHSEALLGLRPIRCLGTNKLRDPNNSQGTIDVPCTFQCKKQKYLDRHMLHDHKGAVVYEPGPQPLPVSKAPPPPADGRPCGYTLIPPARHRCPNPACTYSCWRKAEIKRHLVVHSEMDNGLRPFRCNQQSPTIDPATGDMIYIDCIYRAKHAAGVLKHHHAEHVPHASAVGAANFVSPTDVVVILPSDSSSSSSSSSSASSSSSLSSSSSSSLNADAASVVAAAAGAVTDGDGNSVYRYFRRAEGEPIPRPDRKFWQTGAKRHNVPRTPPSDVSHEVVAVVNGVRVAGYNLTPTRKHRCTELQCTYSTDIESGFREHQRMHREAAVGMRIYRCTLSYPWTDAITGRTSTVLCSYHSRRPNRILKHQREDHGMETTTEITETPSDGAKVEIDVTSSSSSSSSSAVTPDGSVAGVPAPAQKVVSVIAGALSSASSSSSSSSSSTSAASVSATGSGAVPSSTSATVLTTTSAAATSSLVPSSAASAASATTETKVRDPSGGTFVSKPGTSWTSRDRFSGYSLQPPSRFRCAEYQCTFSTSNQSGMRDHMTMHLETRSGQRTMRCAVFNPWTDPVTGQTSLVPCSYHCRENRNLLRHQHKDHNVVGQQPTNLPPLPIFEGDMNDVPVYAQDSGYNLNPPRTHRCQELHCTYSTNNHRCKLKHKLMHAETAAGRRPYGCTLLNTWPDPDTGKIVMVPCTYHSMEHADLSRHQNKDHMYIDRKLVNASNTLAGAAGAGAGASSSSGSVDVPAVADNATATPRPVGATPIQTPSVLPRVFLMATQALSSSSHSSSSSSTAPAANVPSSSSTDSSSTTSHAAPRPGGQLRRSPKGTYLVACLPPSRPSGYNLNPPAVYRCQERACTYSCTRKRDQQRHEQMHLDMRHDMQVPPGGGSVVAGPNIRPYNCPRLNPWPDPATGQITLVPCSYHTKKASQLARHLNLDHKENEQAGAGAGAGAAVGSTTGSGAGSGSVQDNISALLSLSSNSDGSTTTSVASSSSSAAPYLIPVPIPKNAATQPLSATAGGIRVSPAAAAAGSSKMDLINPDDDDDEDEEDDDDEATAAVHTPSKRKHEARVDGSPGGDGLPSSDPVVCNYTDTTSGVVCGRSCRDNKALRQHQNLHSGRFTCYTVLNAGQPGERVCGFKTTHASFLRTHQRVHTGEKPFRCDTCHVGFSKTYSLTLHLRTTQHRHRAAQQATGINATAAAPATGFTSPTAPGLDAPASAPPAAALQRDPSASSSTATGGGAPITSTPSASTHVVPTVPVTAFGHASSASPSATIAPVSSSNAVAATGGPGPGRGLTSAAVPVVVSVLSTLPRRTNRPDGTAAATGTGQ